MSDISIRTVDGEPSPAPEAGPTFEMDPDEYRKTQLGPAAVPQFEPEEVPDIAGGDILPDQGQVLEGNFGEAAAGSLVSFEVQKPFIRFLDMPLEIEDALRLYQELGTALDEAEEHGAHA